MKRPEQMKHEILDIRCPWAANDLAIQYHDTEWGVPLHDDRGLFEFLILEVAQAGLSWDTILRKRENYRKAFDSFDPAKVARYSEAKCEKLLQNDGIIRNRLKIASAIENAKAFLDRKSTRLNSSHLVISYAVFCLKKKNESIPIQT